VSTGTVAAAIAFAEVVSVPRRRVGGLRNEPDRAAHEPRPENPCGGGGDLQLALDFVHGGAHGYDVSLCAEGPFEPLTSFVFEVESAMVVGSDSALVGGVVESG
jgi:hypothetical protein